MKSKYIFFSAALMLASTVHAKGAVTDFERCTDNAAGVTSNMLECISVDVKRQDSRLNKAYKELMAQQSSASRKKQLQEVQRLWIRFRDANCDFYGDPQTGGSMQDLTVRECYRSSTEHRAKELESLKQ